MKLVLAHNSYQQRGGEDVVFEQECALLRAAGHEVIEFRRSNQEINGDGSSWRQLRLAARTVWARDSYAAFAELLARERPDLVHVHNTLALISPSIFWAAKRAGVPVVQTLHNYRLLCPGANLHRDGHPCEDCVEHSLWRSVAHGCYRGSRPATATVALTLAVHRRRRTWTDAVDRYITLSSFARSRYLRAGWPAEKLAVKPNFVHPDPGERTGGGDCAVVIGRLSREKGTHTLAAAWQRLAHVPLRIIGDGPARAELEHQTRGLNVSFTGKLPREQMFEELRRARFLVFPSEVYENFPMALVEAYACGVPVIASRIGAAQEIIQEGHTGLLFRAGAADDLAAKVAWACSHSDEMQGMGTIARAEYLNKYTAKRNYQLLSSIYEDVLADAPAAPPVFEHVA